ncbi:rab-GTPase-TBC domain-domain-containing protein [Leucosporidium creatinivorum]|uniref:Rab-GTPase-TBC domain-domain-containing protein n=1 Tax=Leucosporidium creatinivorum TaxID=106004 RepID=A0A1Y2DHU7_9BASI|nr:rab-GTPase-TBC domain-domain-containing protein [Leucosporidium creatinivorum]
MSSSLEAPPHSSSSSTAELEPFLAILCPSTPPNTTTNTNQRLTQLRQLILLESLPKHPAQAASIRPLVWKLLLRLNLLPQDVHHDIHPLLDSQTYLDLVSRSASPMFSKIRNDTFRTLATDLEFRQRVGEERLVRCLEAFVWRQLDSAANEAAGLHSPSSAPPTIDPGTPYVQGMNVLAAPFLYVLPTELEAFACFCSFIEVQAPRYVRPTLEGVHLGLQLVDRCLSCVDTQLYTHLLSHNLTAELYAFPSLLTFSASTPPLGEVLELWDFLLAWGVGLNVLCVVAQVVIMKDELMRSSSPMKLLRTFPPLKSREIIPLAVQSVGDLDSELYSAVVRHPWDDELVL